MPGCTDGFENTAPVCILSVGSLQQYIWGGSFSQQIESANTAQLSKAG